MVGCGCGKASCKDAEKEGKTFNAPSNTSKSLKECYIAKTESGWAMSSGGKTATATNKKEARRWCSTNCGMPGTCVNRYVSQLPSGTVIQSSESEGKQKMSFWEWLTTPPQAKTVSTPQENQDFPSDLRKDLEMNKEREQRTKFAKASKIGSKVHMAEGAPIHYDAHTSAPPLPDQYPYVYDPVNDYLPRYRYPAGTTWGMGYNPADPYRPLDYQSVTTHQDPRTKVNGGV
tara:strand:+ start:2521 stop:3213 length:693 start_codon:yes stop_codon:yes gene_type:complete